MSSSSQARRPPAGRAAFAILASLLTLQVGAALLSGCAHARAGRPEPPRAPAEGAPARGELDPTEEITPRELASIPDPVPAAPPSSLGARETPPTPAPKAAPEPSGSENQAESPATPAAAPASPGSDSTATAPAKEPILEPPAPAGPWVWRVQVLATPDRSLAERVAREASERLGTTSRIDREPPLYKVRLGAFGSEADAQVLKGRAVEMGYPGAFRVKIRVAATDE